MSSYVEARQGLLSLMAKARDIIAAAPEERRDLLWRIAQDDLEDARTGQLSPRALREAYSEAMLGWVDVARAASGELHSVRVPVRSLRLVEGDDAA